MTDDVVEATRSWLESIDPKVAAAAVVVALCAGVWIGFKVAGGTVADVAQPCQDCAQKEAEAAILEGDGFERPHF